MNTFSNFLVNVHDFDTWVTFIPSKTLINFKVLFFFIWFSVLTNYVLLTYIYTFINETIFTYNLKSIIKSA